MPTESDDDPQQSSAQLQPQQPQQSPPPQQQQQPQAKHALPKFVGHRRRLPPDAPLFEYANIERQLALQDAAVQVRSSKLTEDNENERFAVSCNPMVHSHRAPPILVCRRDLVHCCPPTSAI